MKKINIKGEVFELTFEETYKRFDNFRFKMRNKYWQRFSDVNIDIEDLAQEIDIELWRAYQAYDYDKSNGIAFITFAQTYIEKRLFTIIKRCYTEKRKGHLNNASIDEEIYEGITIKDTIGIDSFEDYIVAKDAVMQEFKRVVPRRYEMLRMLYDGYRGDEVAKKFGTTRQYVHFVKKEFCKKALLKRII